MMDAQNIEAMFAAAATAAEDTNEGNVGGKESVKPEPKAAHREPKAVHREPEKPALKAEVKQETKKAEVKEEPRVVEETPAKEAKKVEKPVQETRREGLLDAREKGIVASGISKESISKILEMSSVFSKYSEREKEFVIRYFGLEVNDKEVISGVVYKALTANQRELDAISKLVIARGESPAERAFYLMDLDNNSVEAVAEQVELLTGDLEGIGRVVNAENKIMVCRKIESSISSMTNDVFAYITKLQEFTKIAIS